MRVPRLRPKTYRAITFASLVSLAAIVVTGALVRLTDSGLGCSDWPRCNDDKIIDVSSTHAAVEQINRLFTGVVSLAVILAVAGSLIRSPRRKDLTWLSLSLVIGVIGQAVVGGIVVLTHLNPIAVQQHFLLSMVILAAAVVLHRRATLLDGERWVRAVEPGTMRLVWLVAALTALAIVTGTVTTGTGPHSGMHKGEYVRRFGFEISSVARVHSSAVILTVLSALWLVWRVRGRSDRLRLENAISTVLVVALTQGAVGYLQYFNGVPVVLVALHVGFATTLWLSVVYLLVATRSVVAGEQPLPTNEAGELT
ncbi:MAG: COX15/CtaA family protein, partial [Actinomycetota bacterium]